MMNNMTHTERMNYLATIRRNEALIERLDGMVRDTPISKSFGVFGQVLVDQGLADTRAGAIDSCFIVGNDYIDFDKLTTAICNCDGSNFPHLLKIAPRLIKICLEVNTASPHLALIERLEGVLND